MSPALPGRFLATWTTRDTPGQYFDIYSIHYTYYIQRINITQEFHAEIWYTILIQVIKKCLTKVY